MPPDIEMNDKHREKGLSDHYIIVVGASAGGLQAISQLVSQLPAELPAAVFIVQHMAAQSPSVMAGILNRLGRLPAKQVENGERFRRGRIYVAVPDHHLLIESSRVYATKGPKENRSRPAIDPLFRSAASAHGPRVIAIILSGMLDDGTAGLAAVKRCGGITMVQDPREAAYSEMPQSALDHVEVDYCVPVDAMAETITTLLNREMSELDTHRSISDLELELQIASGKVSRPRDTASLGNLTSFSCPECGGPLWNVNDSSVDRFRCHTGHAFTAQTLAADLSSAAEQSLWVALRTMEDRARMFDRLKRRHEDHSRGPMALRFAALADEAREHVEQLRAFLRTVWEN